jgi:NAD(P)H-hydrate repair Nnr-like enzyme with NAD(P)H-hydrate dehydratase domain
MDTNWLKQTDKPLFPDLIWSRPQRKTQAGHLLIIGGHSNGFDTIAKIYTAAIEAGVGEIKVALPDRLRKLLAGLIETAIFVPSTPSGSIGEKALADLLTYTDWGDLTILCQLGTNSETALLTARFINRYRQKLVLMDDMLHTLSADIDTLIKRPNTLWVVSSGELKSLVQHSKTDLFFKNEMGLMPFVKGLDKLSKTTKQPVVSVYEKTVVVAADNRVTTTECSKKPDIQALGAWCSVWWLQQPDKLLESLTTAVFEF